MRIQLAAVLLAAATGTSAALVRPAEPPTTYRLDGARAHRDTAYVRTLTRLPGWQALMDRDTNVPLRMWGPGIATFGSVADAAVAESAARAFLAAHLDVLAPGAAITDFTTIANQLDGTLRSVAFAQSSNGTRVVGAAVGFEFKNDRLFSVTSTALPHVQVAPAVAAPVALAGQAQVWLASEGLATRATGPSTRVILPIVRHGEIRYRLVEQLPVVETNGPGRWDVFLDASSGAPVVRQSRVMYASGKVLFDVPDQSPTGTRSAQPAPFATHTVAGGAVTSLADGTVTWTGSAATVVAPAVSGPVIKVHASTGGAVSTSLPLLPDGTVTWSEITDGKRDAQLDSYVYANEAKSFVRARLNPNLAWLDEQLSVTVNENDTCNAYSTGDDIHFYIANSECENTGRIRDVVFHEFGHSVHNNSIIPGMGQFDSSLSEGLADTLAVSITGDHGLGRGFFYNDEPLRDVDPVGLEKSWPADADGEPHDEGEIIGETLWDLRKALIAQDGAEAGFAKFLELYYGVMQRSADIPSTYLAALVTDDDDGDLTNGTPDLCVINSAFGLHGLADPRYTLDIATPARDQYAISFTATPAAAAAACPGNVTVSSAKLLWHVHNAATEQTVDFTASGTTYASAIPTQPDNSLIDYQVVVTLSNGTQASFPDNAADPYYQMYVGPVTKLYCADFEGGATDWTHAGTKDEWQVGAPKGLFGDPMAAHGGSGAFGTDLTTDGAYKSSASEHADSPVISTVGYTDVHLQYYRWLTVQDAMYDRATITANGTQVWRNKNAGGGFGTAGTPHLDKEWRFSDVDLSAQATAGSVQLRFDLTSDTSGNFGGWTIDDVCVVGIGQKMPAPAACGNGIVESGETCDDGNTVSNDGCSATCTTESVTPGDDEPPPVTTKDDGGCNTTGGGSGLAVALGALLLRRRGRR